MLVLSRKKDESIVINNDITIVVVEIRGDKVRLGVEAPKEVPVHRREVFDAITEASTSATFAGEGLGGVADRIDRSTGGPSQNREGQSREEGPLCDSESRHARASERETPNAMTVQEAAEQSATAEQVAAGKIAAGEMAAGQVALGSQEPVEAESSANVPRVAESRIDG